MANATSSENAGVAASSGRPPILSIHHTALRCFDAEAARQFYEDVLGLNFNAAQVFDHNGLEPVDFMHVFFRMRDGDFLAFFDAPRDLQPDFYKRYGQMDFRKTLRVATEAELLDVAERLSAAGVEYAGPVTHELGKSIFFKDPDGIHLEVLAPVSDYEDVLAQEKNRAREVLAGWTQKTAARKAGFKRAPVPA